MKMNETPYRTSVNYGINNIEVADAIFDKKLNTFANFSAEKCLRHTKKLVKANRIISSELDLQLQKSENKYQLHIDKNTDKPIEIEFKFDKNNNLLVDVLSVEVDSGVKAQVVVRYSGKIEAYHNALIKTRLQKNAQLEICVLTNLRNDSNNFVVFDNELEDDTNLSYTIVDFGCKNSIQNFYSRLDGSGAKCKLNSMYFAGEDALLDLNYLQEVVGQRCRAEIEAVGALRDNASKNFKGTIDFKKGCKKSFGAEEEFCMLLSKTAKSKALPMLLCAEEDVDGKHSTSVGKVGEKEKFYIMSRGLNEAEALKLIVKAKFNNLIEQLFDEKLKVEIVNIIDRKFEDEKH